MDEIREKHYYQQLVDEQKQDSFEHWIHEEHY
jgi:hypothetical protein